MSKQYLIVKPSSLGDVLHAFPAVAALCRETGAQADWLIHPAFEPLLEYLPCVRKTIRFERTRLGSARTFLPAFLSLWKGLRTEKYDAVIDLQGLLRSASIGFLARASVHAGPAQPREGAASFFYSKKLTEDTGKDGCLHALVKNNRAIEDFLGRTDIDFHFEMPERPDRAAAANRLLDSAGVSPNAELIGAAPGARWNTKAWPPEFFSAVLTKLAEARPNAQFVLLGSKSEQGAAETIRQTVRGARIVDLAGKTSLFDLVEIIRRCSLFLCNDSGPMHIAAALGVPVEAFFGPTSPELTGPYTERKAVLQPAADCLRCFRRRCESMRCHDLIDPGDAAAAALNLLSNTKGN